MYRSISSHYLNQYYYYILQHSIVEEYLRRKSIKINFKLECIIPRIDYGAQKIPEKLN